MHSLRLHRANAEDRIAVVDGAEGGRGAGQERGGNEAEGEGRVEKSEDRAVSKIPPHLVWVYEVGCPSCNVTPGELCRVDPPDHVHIARIMVAQDKARIAELERVERELTRQIDEIMPELREENERLENALEDITEYLDDHGLSWDALETLIRSRLQRLVDEKVEAGRGETTDHEQQGDKEGHRGPVETIEPHGQHLTDRDENAEGSERERPDK